MGHRYDEEFAVHSSLIHECLLRQHSAKDCEVPLAFGVRDISCKSHVHALVIPP